MLFSDYAIVALICGLASTLIAGKKGRNQYLWFFIGLIGSVFAILAIISLKKKISNNLTNKNKKDG